jgi:D-glycero-D-manno-heptose 1,7-bisphosphate phosphatase
MARYSVDSNIITPGTDASPGTDPALANLMMGTLTFPAEYTKHTIALDRDGVLCECRDVIAYPEHFQPIANSMRAVAIMRSLGHRIAILFDQPMIGRKQIDVPQVEAMNQHMLNLLGAAGCTSIDGIFYNTSAKKRDPYSKPNTGLFTHAEGVLPGVKVRGGMYVGDSIEDLIMANKHGATPVLVLTGNGKKTQAELERPIYKLLRPRVRIYQDLMALAVELAQGSSRSAG